ncbi:hypothetical protein BGX38DRAFT_1279575 [Terfezia claveryi]|nr:hypothetical protein BGX38DRAFT_1279575 [Terfezia claveryi]
MPPLSKKRKACIASTAKACEARKAQRILSDNSNTAAKLYFDSEVEDSELVLVANIDEELVIEEDALARFITIANLDSEEPSFKYQRGVQQSRIILYQARKKQADLQYAATNTAKITEFFASKATVNTNSSLPKDIRKRVYMDGYKWDDVIAYCQNIFLLQMDEIHFSSSLQQWDEDSKVILTCLPLEEKEKILVTHNKSMFNANNGKRQM